jgi:hypothetical protein
MTEQSLCKLSCRLVKALKVIALHSHRDIRSAKRVESMAQSLEPIFTSGSISRLS